MADNKKGASSTAKDKRQFAEDNNQILRDVTKIIQKSDPTVNKETLKEYMKAISSNEKNLRNTAWYLYYRSNIFSKIVSFYSGMWCLGCRKIMPNYSMVGENDNDAMLKNYEDTLVWLDKMNLQTNMVEILRNVYIQDVCYAITYFDDNGMFFYILDPDECAIDSRYSTTDFGFAVDMSKWRNQNKQTILEIMGEPLQSMYNEYERTGNKWIHCPDEYAACFKFRTERWDTVVPPLLANYLQLAALEDLVDIQADADALDIYKLLYIPLKTRNNQKQVNEWEIDPAMAKNYFDKLTEAVPENVAGAIVPGDELKVIDFARTVDSDTTSVEKTANQILQTAGGGAVINSNNINSSAAFNAWLKSETEYAMSTLIGQVNGFANRMLSFKLNNHAKVEHFEVSIYTREELRKSMLESCQYGYNNKIAYNTLLGFSERETMAQIYFEENVLKLHEKMIYPLSSSFVQSGNNGAPTKDDGEISDEGDKSRDKD